MPTICLSHHLLPPWVPVLGASARVDGYVHPTR